ncbi:Rossmann-like and DUF2520 domain-containing protein [Timonella senegalensis]|uniref:Rossmann-like and DUF2520 domain-containing protein n=1 Tax=Timonella senegalensis TaxID=1465825 RepID=UPI003A5C2765
MVNNTENKPGRLGVGIIGAGRVGAVLGSALRAAGHAVIGVSALSEASHDRADALLPGVPVLEPQQIVERSELVLVTVPDDVIGSVVQGLADLEAWQPGQIVVHTSGAHGLDVLAPARAKGAIPIAIHPAMTFTGTSLDLGRIEGATFAVTAPAPVLPIGQALVVELGGEPVVLEDAQRGLYHAALAHGANHLVVLVAQAAQLLEKAGIPNPGQALSPLLYAALEGALAGADGTSDPIATLTGPVVRGDSGTVKKHVQELESFAVSERATDIVESYRALGRAATVRAMNLGRITEKQAQELLDSFE